MSKTVLIIEDDTFIQGMEATKIKKEGYNVLVAVSAEQAFKIIDDGQQLDLILLDLLLPIVDGFSILEKIRKNPKYTTVPVIVFSNISEDKDIKHAQTLGISEFMIKSNFTLDELSMKIKDLIGV